MYIQDNAFLHNRPCTGFATSMPEIFHDGQYPTYTSWNAPKKRKRSDDDNEPPDFKRVISSPEHQLGLLNSPLTQQDHNQQSVTLLQPQNTLPPIHLHTPTQPLPKRRRSSQKTPRSSPGRCSTAPPQLQTTNVPPPPIGRRISSPAISPKTVPISMLMLRACHICHRKPFTRTHLNSYINCELCIERTCYICVRECGSPECCGRVHALDGETVEGSGARKVCSRCAVESGADGEAVRCRECWEEESNPQLTDSQGVKWIQESSFAHMDGMAGSLHR